MEKYIMEPKRSDSKPEPRDGGNANRDQNSGAAGTKPETRDGGTANRDQHSGAVGTKPETREGGNANRDQHSGAQPVGMSAGAASGGSSSVVAGGMPGKGNAEAVNPTTEHAYWRKEYGTRSYFKSETPYEQVGPAYQYGWESCASHKGKSFQDVESQLSRDWDSRRGASKLAWHDAKNAVRDAWQRAEKTSCGDANIRA
jgi:hypothetical protein